MAKKPLKPIEGAPIEALRSDPRDAAREAEKRLDAPHRSEMEEANREKERTRPHGDKVMRDIGTDLPPD